MSPQPRKNDEEKAPEQEGGQVPPEQWSVEPPFDSADYLEGDPPSYGTDESTVESEGSSE